MDEVLKALDRAVAEMRNAVILAAGRNEIPPGFKDDMERGWQLVAELADRGERIARRLRTQGNDYRRARGVVGGTEPAEQVIRRLRGE